MRRSSGSLSRRSNRKRRRRIAFIRMAESMLGFETPKKPQDNQLQYLPNWLNDQQAWEVFDLLRSELPWSQGELNMFGRKVKTPRLECFLSDPELEYTYSGQTMKGVDWPACLQPILQRLRREIQPSLNACLANYYRNGEDKVGWHADDEPELGDDPLIASLSLGASRTFQLRHNQTQDKHSMMLEHGSLLVMKDHLQRDWKHQIPAEKAVQQGRINLTFRTILKPSGFTT